ncbi:phosphatidylserine decarboxylase [Sulfurovum sp. NBC37-1]|uniref:phosphatidylserine decarboxylase n=1 Tax=Sulfurovum sp. (strain NBC37-1) TaxID=387093 RepID=UPI00015875F0|nr:phosphatidylserine decarboxylase [Sulfurovum sp. NBC37-1]BAF71841.1 phosphatidylserine decarboxylase [Sulfurovum sp. NBC37-1]
MKKLKLFTGIVFLIGMISSSVVYADTSLGVRIPTAYFATTGAGQSNDGIPPDPYETFSYDLALQDAGIENFNVMYYTSVLPPQSYEISLKEAKKQFHHGAVLESIMAKASGVKGDTVVAGVGRVWAKDPKSGKKIGGFAAEYEFVYHKKRVAQEEVRKKAKAQLTKSLKHELSIRHLEQVGDMTYNIKFLHITKKYGMVLSQLGFVSFIYVDPIKKSTDAQAHKPITQKLITLLKKNPELKRLLEKSIAKAKVVNPDTKTNPVQNLNDYYAYLDKAVELIPSEVLKHPKHLLREQIMQSLCYFYFLIDQPLPELEGKGLYNNTLQYYEPFSTWTRAFANDWGMFLDTEKSWSKKTYEEFYKDPRFGLDTGWYEPASNWKTFNDFFSRYLKSPEMRPIATPADPSIVVAPADSVPQGTWAIDKDSRIKVEGGLKVKLATYYSVKDLVGEDSPYKDAFANGVLTHTFLDVNDYHRYHFAVRGEIKEVKNIVKNVSLEVVWDAKQGKYAPIDSTGWQFTQTRGVVVVDTGKYGLVALIPMGMAQVSSVNFEGDVRPGIVHKKGDMLGNFLFGGSDFVILFQDKAGFEITASKTPNDTNTYKHMLMGEAYGVMKGNQ